jgi:hypothetical protein
LYTQLVTAAAADLHTLSRVSIAHGSRHITPDVINVIKMPSFQYFLYIRAQEKSLRGLDPMNREGVPAQLFVY